MVSGQIWNNTAGGSAGGGFVCSAGLGAFVDGECLHKNILRYNPYLNAWTEMSNSNPFDIQGIELAAFAQDDCGFGYATAGRVSSGVNFKHFKFSDASDGDYIQGPSIVCSTSNSTFTLQLSNSGSVMWTTSPNITIVSGQGTKNLVVKGVSSSVGSSGSIQATINIDCRVVSFMPKTVWVGKPNFATPISGPSELLVVSSGNYQVTSALGASGNYIWSVQPNWEMYSSGPIANGSAAIIVANSTGYKTITVSTSNACGSVSTQKTVNGVTSCSTSMTVSPNPSRGGGVVVNVVPPPGRLWRHSSNFGHIY